MNSNASTFANSDWTCLTPFSCWEQIKADIKCYYGFVFPDDEEDCLETILSVYGVQKLSLLRSFSLKTGVQILLREYPFNKNGAAGKAGGNTFCQEDILNVFPVVKHIDPKVSLMSDHTFPVLNKWSF